MKNQPSWQNEQASIAKLQTELLKTHAIDTSGLKENDKTPTWDGDLLYLPSGGKVGARPIRAQVKSMAAKSADDLLTKQIKYHGVSLEDLENFRSTGGAIFFVGLVWDDECRIYYSDLLPVKIWDILSKAKGAKTTTIALEPWPEDPSGMLAVIIGHIQHSKLQYSSADAEPIPIQSISPDDELTIKTFSVLGKNDHDALASIIGKESYAYANVQTHYRTVMIPSEYLGRISALVREGGERELCVRGKLWYRCQMTETIDASGHRYSFGETLGIRSADDGSAVWTVNVCGKVGDQIRNLEFLTMAADDGFITIDGRQVRFPIDRDALERRGLANRLAHLKRLEKLLAALDYHDKLEVSEITKTDASNVGFLYESIVEHKAYRTDKLGKRKKLGIFSAAPI